MTLTAGFDDPVLDCQACFRAVLDAMARPGTIHAVTGPAQPPGPLDRATAAVVLTLIDAETPLFLDAGAAAAVEWITFHTGAVPAPVGSAPFVVALSPMPLGDLDPGTDEGPELSATLILQVPALGAGRAYQIDGPGLEAPAVVCIEGLPDGFLGEWAANHAAFPRGIDLILCAGDRLTALPRTLRIGAG